MDIQDFAKMLDGREIGMEIKSTEENRAKELGFVIVFGYSDDIAELTGAISDEVGCCDGGTIYLDKNGIFEDCEAECKYSRQARENCKTIEALCHDEDDYFWTYKTDIPHATFDIMEDGEKYCRGIVFEMKSLEAEHITQIIEFAVGDKVEVVSGSFDGLIGLVTCIDMKNKYVEIGAAGVCVGFDFVLNLEKGRKDDVDGLLNKLGREVAK